MNIDSGVNMASAPADVETPDIPQVAPKKAAAPGTATKPGPLDQLRAKKAAGGVTVKPAPKRSQLGKNAMYLTRRGHLYAGLLLAPWVFLYGITGFLFNHPEVWPDQPGIAITSSMIRGTPLAKLQQPIGIATEVLAAINASSPTQYVLVEPDRITFNRGALGAVLSEGKDGKSYNVTINPNGTGTIRENTNNRGGFGGGRGGFGGGRGMGGRFGGEGGQEQPAPFAVKSGFFLKTSQFEQLESGMKTVLSKLKMESAKLTELRVSPLSFQVESEGKKWQVSYNPLAGSIAGTPVQEAPPGVAMSARLFLLRLHMAHGYPTNGDSMRYIWAIMVDAMSLIMVFWGLSGILMWWQIKRTRWLGGLCLVVSIALATYVGIGMHEVIAGGGR